LPFDKVRSMNSPKLISALKRKGIPDSLIEQAQLASRITSPVRQAIREHASWQHWKVLEALQQEGLSEVHFAGSSGYGYNDLGRDLLDRVLARIFGCPAALLRAQCISGTHAIAAGLLGNLRSGDELVSLTGKPYDTLVSIIGREADGCDCEWGTLRHQGIAYRELGLLESGQIDLASIPAALGERTRWVLLQRSRGYTSRPSLTIATIDEVIKIVKRARPDVQVFVDNCYGELVEEQEPTEVGADLVAGSLIKNLGAGIAPTGGYLAGQAVPIERAASRLIAPCIGLEVGPSLGLNRQFLQGLFLAPQIVGEAIEGSVWASCLLEMLGFSVSPGWQEQRTDLVLEVNLGTAQLQQAFIHGIQAAGAVDSKAVPEGWLQPGYDTPILMASASFVAGSSIELSADGPQRPPYSCYLQGGLNFGQIQLGVLQAAARCLHLMGR
jgi:cystathionine beta-lyase family protein involved in aluminum resistance